MERTARISGDGIYRYDLTRHWGPSVSVCTFIMLNPSTADANQDDPTIRRCMGFARRWGHGGLRVVNLYAFRATRPIELQNAIDPMGPENPGYLENAVLWSDVLIAAWGAHPIGVPHEARRVLFAAKLLCLGVTKHGHCRHPLYVRADVTPQPFYLLP